jgi:CheY-like chemotaxis protein
VVHPVAPGQLRRLESPSPPTIRTRWRVSAGYGVRYSSRTFIFPIEGLLFLMSPELGRADPLPGSGTKSGGTILVVEDEDALRTAIRRLLEGEGYRVLEASNGALALEVLSAAEGADIGLVLTDLRMPVMDGRQFAAALVRLRPNLPIVFMSGFTAQLMDLRLISPHLIVLPKPFNNNALLAAVRGQLNPPA